jgi:hypothetical protein
MAVRRFGVDPARPDTPRRGQHVDAAAGPEVQDGLAGTEVGDGDGVPTAQADLHGSSRHAGRVVSSAERPLGGGGRRMGGLGVALETGTGVLQQSGPQQSPRSSHGAICGRRPMISSAADGNEPMHRALIRHHDWFPVRSTSTKHVSPRICRWCDTVDWPTSIASTTSPVVIARASVANRLRIRMRVGSPSALNQPAHVVASSRATVGPGFVTEELVIDD